MVVPGPVHHTMQNRGLNTIHFILIFYTVYAFYHFVLISNTPLNITEHFFLRLVNDMDLFHGFHTISQSLVLRLRFHDHSNRRTLYSSRTGGHPSFLSDRTIQVYIVFLTLSRQSHLSSWQLLLLSANDLQIPFF